MTSSTLAALFDSGISTFWGYVTSVLTSTVGLIVGFGILIAIFGLIFKRSHRGVGK